MNNYYSFHFYYSVIGYILALTFYITFLIYLRKRRKLPTKHLIFSILLFLFAAWISSIDMDLWPMSFSAGRSKLVFGHKWIDGSIIFGTIFLLQNLSSLITIAYPLYHSYYKINVGATQKDYVEEFINGFFRDDRFNHILKTSIPKGTDDESRGLHHISIMLGVAADKRIAATKNARKFLNATISLGLFFVILVIFFGWILLNDTSIGIERDIIAVKSALSDANSNTARLLLEKSYCTNELKDRYAINLEDVKQDIENHSKKQDTIASYLIRTIEQFQQTDKYEPFAKNINFYGNTAIEMKMPYSRSILALTKALEGFSSSTAVAQANYTYATGELVKLIPKIDAEINKPINQTNAIIKRLILSVVIISFFLAILRYVSRLYITNQQLAIKAENEDVAIRKLYIALMNTDKNQDERKMVISGLVSQLNNTEEKETGDISLSKDEQGIVKELLNNLIKKF